MITNRRLRLTPNPIIVKELRSRMRDWRAFATLTGMLILLGGGSYLLYRLILVSSQYTYYTSTPLSPQIGQSLFVALVMLELLAITAVAPAVTAGAISGEQEKLTYEMLVATPLKPGRILWGKLVSALSYVFLLIFAAIPMASLIFIFGGVTLRDMLKALIVLFSLSVTFGMVGLFMSTLLGRTARATIVSYLVVFVLVAAPLVAYLAYLILEQAEPPRWLLVPSPLSAMLSALPVSSMANGGSFFSSFFYYIGMGMLGDMSRISGATMSMTGIPRPLYHYSLPFYGLFSIVLYMLSTRLARPTRRWHLGWKEIVIAIAILALVSGFTSLAYWLSSDRYENSSIFIAPTPLPMPQDGFGGPAWIEPAMVEAVEVAPAISGGGAAVLLGDPIGEGPDDLPVKEIAEIYSAVVVWLYQVDNATGQQPVNPVIYLLNQTDDSIGDPNAPLSDARSISQGVQDAMYEPLLSAFGGEMVRVYWVSSIREVKFDPKQGKAADGGLVIVLGNIHLSDAGTAQVAAAQYIESTGTMGRTYVLENLDGAWTVTGITGDK